MLTHDKSRTQRSTWAMRLVGWSLVIGLPLLLVLYPPGFLWGQVSPDICFPALGPSHPPSPFNGLHPYLFMIAALYLAYGILLIRGATQPERNVALFDFGIWSSVLHALVMVPQALYVPNEHAHLWADVPMLVGIAAILWATYPHCQDQENSGDTNA